MAVSTRKFPPNIAGTIPSFFYSGQGAVILTVPFTMNQTVSNTSIRAFKLRLKTTTTNIILEETTSTSYDLTNGTVNFSLSSAVSRLVVGTYYKIQIAYIGTDDIVGYYSSTAIIKYTAKPTVNITGLTGQSVNVITTQTVRGEYKNDDSSEKVYQYCFILYSNNNSELENSGWLLHNTQEDIELNASFDVYTFKYNLTNSTAYSIMYKIKTNNGLNVVSSQYEIIPVTALNTDPGYILGFLTSIKDENDNDGIDYNNGGVKLKVFPNSSLDEVTLSGNYHLTRASSENNYKIWELVSDLSLNIVVSGTNPYVFSDYTVAAGCSYKYALQKYNATGVLAKQIVSPSITPYFEDAFLYDGQRQLKIKFNPKISSFKSVLSETKKTTLGRQYPFILRSGIVNYKEFQISGLISYLMDENQMFMTANELLKPTKFADTIDITDENISVERRFKLAVLDWLNNGEIKLFKSPQEGNYIVRLMDISLSPNDSVSRMLHTFQCTADEVDSYSIEALTKYSLLNTTTSIVGTETSKTIRLADIIAQVRSQNPGADANTLLQKIYAYDLTEGLPCKSIHVAYELNRLSTNINSRNFLYGTCFEWGTDYNFAIDKTGEYTIELSEPIVAKFSMTKLADTLFDPNNPKDISEQGGYVELIVYEQEGESLSNITGIQSQYLYGYSIYGLDEARTNGYSNRNLFEEFNTEKTKISTLKFIDYRLIPVVQFSESQELLPQWRSFIQNNIGDDPANSLYYQNKVIILWDRDQNYYRYNGNNNFVEITDYGTNVQFGSEIIDVAYPTSSIISPQYTLPVKNGELFLKVQAGVSVHVYAIATTYNYKVEEADSVIATRSTEEFEAYRNYCAAVFNFVSSDDPNEPVTDKYFVFTDMRKFVELTADEAESTTLPKYQIASSLTKYSQQDIISARNAYLSSKILLSNEIIDFNA